MEKLRVGIVGATGMVGQRFITLLAEHPYFELTALVASPASAGKNYGEAVRRRWKLEAKCPERVSEMQVISSEEVEKIASLCDLVFCAVNMPRAEVIALEEKLARAELVVVSNNSANRSTPDVPMLIPEINSEHLAVISSQRKRLGTKRGFIAVKPNCSIQGYVAALTPLLKYGIKSVAVTTYQAISGAGKTFAEWSEMEDNLIPYISGEEEKSEREPLKIWGRVEGTEIVPLSTPTITAQCLRVPVTDGHMAAVFVKFEHKPTPAQIIEDMRAFLGEPQALELPSAPKQFVTYFEENDRPQTKLDRDIFGGMGVSVGRLREDALFDYKFVALAHNTLRGAAGGAVLIAELLYKKGYLDRI